MHATFAESLYGLKRQPAAPQQAQPPGGDAAVKQQLQSAELQATPLLNRRQQHLALLCQVLLPYIKAKCDQLYAKHSPQRGVLGLAIARQAATAQQVVGSSNTYFSKCIATLKQGGITALVLLYPYIHAACEGSKFVYQLMYLLDVTDCHSPILHLLGQRLVRLSGSEMAMMHLAKEQHRQQQLLRAQQHGSQAARLLHSWWLKGASVLTDHMRSVLICSIFAFKILEWWYTSAEDRLSSAAALPPPPAPPPPASDPKGVGLPGNTAQCPICRQKRVNPAALAVSGYVFCYPCLFRHVTEQHSCPVTLTPATLDHIRKLYEAM
eukprot:GHRR01027501.1.p1 GENE.GHRR01027501.1~~GHRR01027501.1.p1  ORF type:complete len:323 (+),score=103.21 GHRR01027501.1:793-1761(+)